MLPNLKSFGIFISLVSDLIEMEAYLLSGRYIFMLDEPNEKMPIWSYHSRVSSLMTLSVPSTTETE